MWDANEVKARARGRWEPILRDLAPELEQALARPGRHVPCPVHGGRDGLRVFKDVAATGGCICNSCGAYPDGFATLQWLRGWRFREALEAVGDWLGGDTALKSRQATDPHRKVAERARQAEDVARRKCLYRAWRDSLPASDPKARPLRQYLAGRGLRIRRYPVALRFHPGLAYHDEEGHRLGVFPAMLAQVSDAVGRPVTVHRTYLTPDGVKAPVEKTKKLMTYPTDRCLSGGAIRLGELGPVLNVAEGIETALAVTQALGQPVWACVSAGLLERFEPPRGTRRVVIWADKDRSEAGQRAAARLMERLRSLGLEGVTLLPPLPIADDQKGIDWLDVLRGLGENVICAASSGVPAVNARLRYRTALVIR